ncbi:DNA-binding NtrC family response regulator [Pedobacter sp. UYP24]
MEKTEILIVCTHEEILKTIARLINSNPQMNATAAVSQEQAITLFSSGSFDLVLIGAGLTNEEETDLIAKVESSRAKVPVISHYGGGSGLLFTEIYQALGK